MSKEMVDNEIDEAYQQIKNGEYEGAVEQLKLLKLRVPESLLKDLKTWEEEHDKVLQERLIEIDKTNKHAFDKETEKVKQVYKYAAAYFRKYDDIRKNQEIY